MDRLDFSSKVINNIRHRASFICSNPDCHILTISASTKDDSLFILNGIVAHIYPASKGGPRYDSQISSEEIQSESNGIYLCANCSIMIDKNNGLDYSAQTLKYWKSEHESWTRKNLNKKVFEDKSEIIEQLSEQTQLLRIIADSTSNKNIDRSNYPEFNYDWLHNETSDIVSIENINSSDIKIIELNIYDEINCKLLTNQLPDTIEFGEKYSFTVENIRLIDGKIKMKYMVKFIFVEPFINMARLSMLGYAFA